MQSHVAIGIYFLFQLIQISNIKFLVFQCSNLMKIYSCGLGGEEGTILEASKNPYRYTSVFFSRISKSFSHIMVLLATNYRVMDYSLFQHMQNKSDQTAPYKTLAITVTGTLTIHFLLCAAIETQTQSLGELKFGVHNLVHLHPLSDQ